MPVQELREKCRFAQPTRDIKVLLQSAAPSSISPAEQKKLSQLADLLSQMFELHPERRITIEKALSHAFIRED